MHTFSPLALKKKKKRAQVLSLITAPSPIIGVAACNILRQLPRLFSSIGFANQSSILKSTLAYLSGKLVKKIIILEA